ncbi:hypothetical protein AJ78_06064, partial [Emergomyces pasteurianus Ep9510]
RFLTPERRLLGFSDEDEDRGLEKGDEFLSNLLFFVECGLVRFTSTKTLHGDNSLILVLNLILQNGLLKLRLD